MSVLPKSIRKLIEELSQLPGIGPKSAQRLTFYLLRTKDLDRERLSEAIRNLKANLAFCRQCHNLAENVLCAICADKNRDQKLICVVEEPLDVVSLEQGRSFNGAYHVLGGVISPIDGVGPENLKINELLERIQNMNSPSFNSSPLVGEERRGGKDDEDRIEVVIATNPSLEGESTALFLAKKLKLFPNLKYYPLLCRLLNNRRWSNQQLFPPFLPLHRWQAEPHIAGQSGLSLGLILRKQGLAQLQPP